MLQEKMLMRDEAVDGEYGSFAGGMLDRAAADAGGIYPNAGDAVDIIVKAAATATAAELVGGFIPGLGIPAMVVSCFGAVWVMYGCICKRLGIKISENLLKVIARAALSNIAANIAGALAVALIGNFIPFVGTVGTAAITFMCVYIAGYIFLRLIANMAKKARDPYDFTGFDPDKVKEEAGRVHIPDSVIDEAKKGYKDSGKK